MLNHFFKIILLSGIATVTAVAQDKPNLNKDGTMRPLTAEEGLKLIEVPKGYKLELVASEPMVKEPVCFAFDGNGALFVCEWLTYMQDQYGTDEHETKSRIVKLEDTDGDGKMDKRTVFADQLLLPRSIICMHDRVLVRLSHSDGIWAFYDTDDDGVADKKIEEVKGKKVGGNIEHQSNTLMWNADNKIYATREVYALKNGKLSAVKNEGSYGQWGLARDDLGRIYGSSNSVPLQYWQHLAGYSLVTPGEQKGLRKANFICELDDATDPGRDITAIGGQSMIRSQQLKEFYGMYVVPDAVRRMVKIIDFKEVGGKRIASRPEAFAKTEFIRSSDVYFRPVWCDMGPDGALYIADMSRGIVQESQWFPTEKTKNPNPRWLSRYYRTKDWGMLKVNQRGRIYRLVPENTNTLEKRPDMLTSSSADLVKFLAHGNGWWRDEAHKIIVSRGDKSAVSNIRKLLIHEKPVTRLLAYRCLEGLGELKNEDTIAAAKDADESVRVHGVALIHKRLDTAPELLDTLVRIGANETSNIVISQLYEVYSKSGTQKGEVARKFLETKHKDLPLMTMLASSRNSLPKYVRKYKAGHKLYRGLCADCHGDGEKGLKVGAQLMAPVFSYNQRIKDQEYLTKVMLKGLQGPLGKNKETFAAGIMPPMGGTYDDTQMSEILNYIGFRWGNWKTEMTPTDVKKIRDSIKEKKGMWTFEELTK